MSFAGVPGFDICLGKRFLFWIELELGRVRSFGDCYSVIVHIDTPSRGLGTGVAPV